MKQASRITLTLVTIIATFLLSALLVSAQGDPLSGKYEGTAKTDGEADTPIVIELKNEGGKISGRLKNGESDFEISEGTLEDKKVSLKLGPESRDGILIAMLDGDKLMGDWVVGSLKRTVELKKAPATAAMTAEPNLSGEWDAVADAQGQNVPFLLTIKVEGEKVTGGSSSQLGDSTISNGTWKDGRISFVLEGASGSIAMTATVVEGKLAGEFDYAGQVQGRWVAVKRK